MKWLERLTDRLNQWFDEWVMGRLLLIFSGSIVLLVMIASVAYLAMFGYLAATGSLKVVVRKATPTRTVQSPQPATLQKDGAAGVPSPELLAEVRKIRRLLGADPERTIQVGMTVARVQMLAEEVSSLREHQRWQFYMMVLLMAAMLGAGLLALRKTHSKPEQAANASK